MIRLFLKNTHIAKIMNEITDIAQPFYMYKNPMFLITASVVVIYENGVYLVKKDDIYTLPTTIVKAGQETIQFAAVRCVKEQVGVILKKNSLIPVDFRSEPERSPSKNIVDMGMVSVLDDNKGSTAKWMEIDFEHKKLVENVKLEMDHSILLERAITLIILMKDN